MVPTNLGSGGLYWACSNTGTGVTSSLTYQDYTANIASGWYFTYNGFLRYFIRFDGAFAGAASDERLKNVTGKITKPLELIENISGIYYTWKNDNEDSDIVNIGLLAQEVEKTLPHAVHTTPEGMKMVNYQSLIPVLLEGIKELDIENKKLRSELDEIKAILKRANLV